jgi:ABC-type glutathione transport system ATPase component
MPESDTAFVTASGIPAVIPSLTGNPSSKARADVASTPTTPVLELRTVSNTYAAQSHNLFGKKSNNNVLKDISFEIQRGEIFGLVGESGCGKTTLSRAILGLVDCTGEILIDGDPYTKARRRDFTKRVQAVLQDPSAALNPTKRVGWLLEEPLRIHHVSHAERNHRVDEVLDLVGLDASYKFRKVDELSGGQKQRVCIGCALMLSPQLIIADEAVSALDVSVGAQILNLFKDLHERLGLSLLFISHNLDVVYYLCDRIAVMNKGEIMELNTAEELYSNPQHPYTKTLLESIPKIKK